MDKFEDINKSEKSKIDILRICKSLHIDIAELNTCYNRMGKLLEITDKCENKYYAGFNFDNYVSIIKEDSIDGRVIYLLDGGIL